MKVFNVSLNKRWKEVLFALSGFGPNMLMTLMMAYFTDAVLPQGLAADINFWSYGGFAIVSIAVFPILWTIGRCFDGIIDVPLAHLTDSIRNKTGKRFISYLISFVPMAISFVLCWIPICGTGEGLTTGQLIGNSLWIFAWSIVFFASYTMALITFYGSLSEVCKDQTQRSRVSAYKSVFDTISYALVYAAIPAIFKGIGLPIWQVALYMSPLMLTILVPLTLQKKEIVADTTFKSEENVPIGLSIKLTLKSRPFMKWTLVNCAAFFGLQMFLVSQNALISGLMNLGAGYAAILNTCAFAPVPIMLYFFNRVRRKKGIRFCYQTCLLTFAIALFSFGIGSQYFFGDNVAPKLIIGCIGGVVGSWGIGGFFMVPYLIPTVIGSVEEEVTHKNHSAMYFAVQALATSIVGAIASSLIYNYIKVWVEPSAAAPGGEWKLGVSLVPLIVAVACLIGFGLCFLMPKQYTAKVIFNDIKKSNENTIKHLNKKKAALQCKYDAKVAEINATGIAQAEKDALISDLKGKLDIKLAKMSLEIDRAEQIVNYKFDETKSSANEEKQVLYERSGIVANVGLYFLSLMIYNIIDEVLVMRKLAVLNHKLSGGQKALVIISFFVPFVSIAANIAIAKQLELAGKDRGAEVTYGPGKMAGLVISSMFLPCFLNFVNLIMFDRSLNKIIDAVEAKEAK